VERGGVDLPHVLGGVAHYMVGAEVMGGGIHGLGSGLRLSALVGGFKRLGRL